MRYHFFRDGVLNLTAVLEVLRRPLELLLLLLFQGTDDLALQLSFDLVKFPFLDKLVEYVFLKLEGTGIGISG